MEVAKSIIEKLQGCKEAGTHVTLLEGLRRSPKGSASRHIWATKDIVAR